MNLQTKTLGSGEHAYVQISDGTKWYATVRPEHAEAVKAAIAAAIAKDSHQNDAAQGRD